MVPKPAESKVDFNVLDLSALTAGDDGWQLDTGVTSGADSASWEEISVDDQGADGCADGSGEGAGANGSAICHSEKK
jgi:hypothetical protein